MACFWSRFGGTLGPILGPDLCPFLDPVLAPFWAQVLAGRGPRFCELPHKSQIPKKSSTMSNNGPAFGSLWGPLPGPFPGPFWDHSGGTFGDPFGVPFGPCFWHILGPFPGPVRSGRWPENVCLANWAGRLPPRRGSIFSDLAETKSFKLRNALVPNRVPPTKTTKMNL